MALSQMYLDEPFFMVLPRDEEEDEDGLAVAAATVEGVAHEGGEVRDVLVGLLHLARPQLHVDGLRVRPE